MDLCHNTGSNSNAGVVMTPALLFRLKKNYSNDYFLRRLP